MTDKTINKTIELAKAYGMIDSRMKRVMGEIVFLSRDEADVAGAKVRNAGFEFLITPDVDPDDPDIAFAMIWKDCEATDEDRALADFSSAVNAVIALPNNLVDYVSVVSLDHVPTHFSDYGELLTD